jgi:hypothetical protein
LSHPRIHVEVRRNGRETRIRVSGWPREDAALAIYTTNEAPAYISSPEWDPGDEQALARRLGGSDTAGRLKGRVLQAVGFRDFDYNAAVGALLLHIGPANRLRILRVQVVEGLTGLDELEIRAALVACAGDLAAAMKEKGIGDGCLDWEVRSDAEGGVMRLYPGFVKAPQSQQPRGPRSLLRMCPDAPADDS